MRQAERNKSKIEQSRAYFDLDAVGGVAPHVHAPLGRRSGPAHNVRLGAGQVVDVVVILAVVARVAPEALDVPPIAAHRIAARQMRRKQS